MHLLTFALIFPVNATQNLAREIAEIEQQQPTSHFLIKALKC